MNPYLLFNGSAADAIDHYKKTLGATVEFVQLYGDAPMPSAENWKDKILHSTVKIQGQTIMISDSSPEIKVTMGDNIQLALNYTADPSIDEKFEALSEGGTVKMPLQKTFWAKKFGMLVDKFGVHWMFNQE